MCVHISWYYRKWTATCGLRWTPQEFWHEGRTMWQDWKNKRGGWPSLSRKHVSRNVRQLLEKEGAGSDHRERLWKPFDVTGNKGSGKTFLVKEVNKAGPQWGEWHRKGEKEKSELLRRDIGQNLNTYWRQRAKISLTLSWAEEKREFTPDDEISERPSRLLRSVHPLTEFSAVLDRLLKQHEINCNQKENSLWMIH